MLFNVNWQWHLYQTILVKFDKFNLVWCTTTEVDLVKLERSLDTLTKAAFIWSKMQ